MPNATITEAVASLRAGGVIAYPTESVYGFGCDPLNQMAVQKLLSIKNRPIEKGLIVIAAHQQQLHPFIDPKQFEQLPHVAKSWPGPHTWILPCRPETPKWLTGNHSSLAVRVTAHNIAAQLCTEFQHAIISTSANRSGESSLTTTAAVKADFNHEIDYIVPGNTSGSANPTTIKDAISGQIIRL